MLKRGSIPLLVLACIFALAGMVMCFPEPCIEGWCTMFAGGVLAVMTDYKNFIKNL